MSSSPLRKPDPKPMTVPASWAKSERTKILEWRAECLERVGASRLTASALATTDHDLHQMERAYRSGMTDAQAAQVFL